MRHIITLHTEGEKPYGQLANALRMILDDNIRLTDIEVPSDPDTAFDDVDRKVNEIYPDIVIPSGSAAIWAQDLNLYYGLIFIDPCFRPSKDGKKEYSFYESYLHRDRKSNGPYSIFFTPFCKSEKYRKTAQRYYGSYVEIPDEGIPPIDSFKKFVVPTINEMLDDFAAWNDDEMTVKMVNHYWKEHTDLEYESLISAIQAKLWLGKKEYYQGNREKPVKEYMKDIILTGLKDYTKR